MSNSWFLKCAVLATFSMFAVACGESEDNTAGRPCHGNFVASCDNNTSLTCEDGVTVKTNCGDKGCWRSSCAPEPDQSREGEICTSADCNGIYLHPCRHEAHDKPLKYDKPITCPQDTVCTFGLSGYAKCEAPCAKADEGHVRKVCETHDDTLYAVNYTCIRDDDGTYAYIPDDLEESQACPASCYNGECVKLSQNDGEECDPKTFIEHCENNMVVFCKFHPWEADTEDWLRYSVSSYVCEHDSILSIRCQTKKLGNYAACAYPCTQGDPTLGSCTKNGFYSNYTLNKYACKEASDSNFYYFPAIPVSDCQSCDAKTLTCKRGE